MYQVIARKYRPQSFADLVNQEHIKRTLSNAIEHRRIAHGYIFSGQRGTGKTTVARIMARCLNCAEGPTMTPCGVCSSCREVSAGNSVDVIEIDAASNRGINEMRELRESVRFRPARDKYKVFIIDEAHQITNDAFNALLKTLEEPPEWVVFMLCTTESHKLPATISSRCQHFSFRSVEMDEVVARMEWICTQEGITADRDALTVIAQAGGGSVRDSLSALDQAIACCGNTLEADEVRRLMGAYSLETLHRVTEALTAGSAQTMLEVVDELERSGQNLQHFCRELSSYFRNLLVARVAGANGRLILATKPELERLTSIAEGFSERDLTRYLNITLELFGQLQHSLQPRFHLELGLMRLVEAGRIVALEQAISAFRRVEESTPQAPPNSSGETKTSGGMGGATRAGGALGASISPSFSAPATSGTTTSGTTPPGSTNAGATSGPRSKDAFASTTLGGSSTTPGVGPVLSKPLSATAHALATQSSLPAPHTTPLPKPSRPAPPPRLEVLHGGREKPVGAPPSPSVTTSTSNTQPEEPKACETDTASSPDTSALHSRLVELLNDGGKRFTADGIERSRLSLHTLPGGDFELRVLAPKDTSLSLKEGDLREYLRELEPPVQRVRIEFGNVDPVPVAARPTRSSADEAALLQEVQADPEMQRIQELFRGRITKVRSLRG